MAASGLQSNANANNSSSSSSSFMEQYTKGISAVETILSLDHLRQKVAVKELLRGAGSRKSPPHNSQANGEQSQFMRKTVSVPNFSQVSAFSLFSSNTLALSPQAEGKIFPVRKLFFLFLFPPITFSISSGEKKDFLLYR